MFSMICAWINSWVNNREAGDLWRHRTHYDVIVMILLSHLIAMTLYERHSVPDHWLFVQHLAIKINVQVPHYWPCVIDDRFPSQKAINAENFSMSWLYAVMFLYRTDALQWRHNGRDGVSNHRCLDGLLNRLSRCRSKKNIKGPRHWPLRGEFAGDQWLPLTKGH